MVDLLPPASRLNCRLGRCSAFARQVVVHNVFYRTLSSRNRLLQRLIPDRQDLLITPDYSKDTEKVCPRCRTTTAFRFADPKLVLSILPLSKIVL